MNSQYSLIVISCDENNGLCHILSAYPTNLSSTISDNICGNLFNGDDKDILKNDKLFVKLYTSDRVGAGKSFMIEKYAKQLQIPPASKPKPPYIPPVPMHQNVSPFPSPRAQPLPTAELHVSNLRSNIRPFDLKRAFGQFGTINNVKIKQDRYNQQKAFAFVKFRYRADAEKAQRNMNGSLLSGKRIWVKWAKGNQNRNRRYFYFPMCFILAHSLIFI